MERHIPRQVVKLPRQGSNHVLTSRQARRRLISVESRLTHKSDLTSWCGESDLTRWCGESGLTSWCGEPDLTSWCGEPGLTSWCGESGLTSWCGESGPSFAKRNGKFVDEPRTHLSGIQSDCSVNSCSLASHMYVKAGSRPRRASRPASRPRSRPFTREIATHCGQPSWFR